MNEIGDCKKAWYKFNLKHIRGFQYCEPRLCKNVYIQYFAPLNEQYMLVAGGMKQEELDDILLSIDKNYN